MKPVHFNFRRMLHRRSVIRGTGVAMSLPWLTAMRESFAAPTAQPRPKRFISTTLGLGLVGDNLNPVAAGPRYQSTPYLDALQDIRDRFTVISGTSHPGVKGGHRAEASILTARAMGTSGQVKNTISLDQQIAGVLDGQTRYSSLILATDGSSSPCYTAQGAMIPPETSPSRLFKQLFVDDSKFVQKRQAERVIQSRSIMDLVGEDAKSLQRELGSGDRDRLDAYFTSVRELERRLQISEAWAKRPKPEVDEPMPVEIRDPSELVGRFRTMCGLIKLAIQTDSTRVISLHIPGSGGVLKIDGVDQGYHSLSHHGRDEEKLAQLRLVETALVAQWGDLLRELSICEEDDGNLLDETSVFMTSNLGNASNHDNRNMPVLVGGGHFKHPGHLAFDQKNNYPLTNLYVSILQQMGIEAESFATSTGTMTGLDFDA